MQGSPTLSSKHVGSVLVITIRGPSGCGKSQLLLASARENGHRDVVPGSTIKREFNALEKFPGPATLYIDDVPEKELDKVLKEFKPKFPYVAYTVVAAICN